MQYDLGRRNGLKALKRAMLASLLWGGSFLPVSAEVVELETTTIGREERSYVQQAQAQVPLPTPDPTANQVPTPPQNGGLQDPAQLQPQTPNQAPGQGQPQAPAQAPGQDQLNTDPDADINDIQVPQAPQAPSAPQNFNTGARGLGATAGAFSAAPTMFGDFQGGGLAQLSATATQSFEFHAPGFYISGSPGAQNATIAFEVGGDTVPNDVFTTGLGIDAAGNDGQFDTFSILEPIPPSDAPTSPGPGFTFDGGSAVFTRTNVPTTAQPGIINDGEQWYITYSYSQQLGPGQGLPGVLPVPSPGVTVRRVKIAENFSPDVRNRWFLNYSFFNDSFGGLGDVSRYVGGFERILLDDLISIEARFPFAGTFGSTQTLGTRQNRDFEFGNPTIIGKGVLLRTNRYIWTGGLGIAVPLADDTVVRSMGTEVVRIKNQSVFLQPFTGMLYRKSRDTSFQGYLQLDVAANGDPVFANLTGGTGLPKVGVFNDSTLLHVDVAMSHTLYRNRCARCLRELLANAELHYTGTLQESDLVEGNNLTFTNLKRHFNIVNATFGMHMVLAKNVVVSPAMSVPLRSGLDEQFDYEAILQVNYLR